MNKKKVDTKYRERIDRAAMAKDLLFDLKIIDSDYDKIRLIEDFISLVLMSNNK